MSEFFDPFTRANSSSTLGSPWSALRGTWGISSNQAYLPGGVAGAVNLVSVDVGEGDGVVQIDVPTLNGTNGGMGIMFRATDVSNHYIADFGSSAPQLFKGVAGTYTSLGTFGAVSLSGDSCRVSFFGSRITCWRLRSGTWSQLLSITDTTWGSTLTKVGMYLYDLDATTRLDNFSFTNPRLSGHGSYGA